MDASEAAVWFANTPVDGWDGTSWVPEVAWGDFHTYDRFISDRTFGAKKRIFLTPEDKKVDVSTYPVIRTGDGQQWIVVSANADIEGVSAYQQAHLILQAGFTADIIEYTTTSLSSGQQRDATENVIATTVCDIERFSVDRSDSFDSVTYGKYKIVLPSNISVDTNKEILVNGDYFEVQEVAPELLTTVIRALRRTT